MTDIFEAERAADIHRMQNPIETAIRTLSFPKDWPLVRVEWSSSAVWVTVHPKTGHKAWIKSAIVGRGKTVDEALRAAQELSWDRWEEFGSG